MAAFVGAELSRWRGHVRALAARVGRLPAGFGRGQTDWNNHLASLREAERGARQHADRLGDAFLATGTRLQEQVRLTGALAEASARFEAFGETGEGANPAREAVESIERTLRRLERAEAESAMLVERLQEQHAAIARLRATGHQLERAFAPLKIIDTLFRIEAASLPAEIQADFAALTHEISQLDQRVRDTFARNFDALGLTRDAIGEVVARLSEQRSSIHEVARSQREAMTHSLVAVQQDMEALRDRDRRARTLVERVDHDANAMVMSLQYQDITKQKLEHVLDAIGDLERRAAGGLAAARPYVRHSCALQARQLDAIEADLAKAVAGLDGGMAGVLQSLDALHQETLGGGRSDHLAGHVSDTLERLIAMLAALGAPSQGVAENARYVSGALQSFGGVTADLGATISDLTWGIRLIALNAQVQAAQVARCDGLEVLARNTYAVSEETSLQAERIGRDLLELSDRLRTLLADANAFEARTREESTELAAAADDLTARLKAERHAVTAALDDFARALESARARGLELVSNSELRQLDSAPLGRLRDRFQGLGIACVGVANHEETPLELRELHHKYTMESERAVHASVLRELRHAPGASVAKVPAEAGAAVGPASAGTRSAPPGATQGSAPRAAEPVAAAPAADLGDNVELF